MGEKRESSQVWNKKSPLEQTIAVGLHGIPEIKGDEKRAYLGVFKEQVITYLTKKQVKEVAIYPEILQALKHQKFHKLLLNGSLDNRFFSKYQQLARKMKKASTILSDSDYREAAGLVVASSEAVNIESTAVKDRHIRLQKLGAPKPLIASAGKKICGRCLNTILTIDPQEKLNYSRLTWLDKLTGDRCPAHDDD